MKKNVGIGIQDFSKIVTEDCFYVDKTHFIKEWWESKDEVTLITRPRRFGKTLNMSMLYYFFSVDHTGRGDLFDRFTIWKEQKYRDLQGTYPVISLSFANVKETTYEKTKVRICQILTDLYIKYSYLRDSDVLTEKDREYFDRVCECMADTDAVIGLHKLSDFMMRYYQKKPVILLDEYDTPMQEAYTNGFWEELAAFTRSMLNATFKTNPYFDRAIMTGITRVSRESIFSDLNNLKVVTTTSGRYADAFGFTEAEVFAALDEHGYTNKDEVKRWYDGFTFGEVRGIYNPWSIANYLESGKIDTYWANTSSNSLISKLVREGNPEVKMDMEMLLRGECLQKEIDEQIVFDQLDRDENAIWSLLLASGYLKIDRYERDTDTGDEVYTVSLTNREVQRMFRRIVKRWFSQSSAAYNGFVRAMLADNVKAMNDYMNKVSLETFSYFDSGKKPYGEPERFYHGFVLGLIVELAERFVITSNRESGFGRYDVMLEPRNAADPAVIMEFKVKDSGENSLEDSAREALEQIDRMEYEAALKYRGIDGNRIRKYGFAFEGKKVLIMDHV